MKRPITPLWKICLLAVTVLATHFHARTGLVVLCLGEDGHLEIETTYEGRCSDCLDDDHTSQLAFQNEEGESHCGSCTDSNLSLCDSRFQRMAPELAPVLPEITRIPVHPRFADVPVWAFPNPPPIGNPGNHFTETIRLLI